MRVYEALAQEFLRQGIDRVFGLMGEDLAKFVVELDRVGIPYVATRHENQAVGMADGYARFSGKLGVALVTSGPGFTNALTLINTAAQAHSPVLVLVGAKNAAEDVPGNESMRTAKYFPYLATCELAGIKGYKPQDPATAVSETRAAIHAAKAGQTILLNLAVDIVEAVAGEDDAAIEPPAAPPALAPDPESISLIADLLQESWAVARPLILAGKGAVKSDAGPALRRLGELTGAALSTSLLATPYFKDDPYYVGVCGTFTKSLGAEVITSADTVLVFGASLNFFTTFGNSLFPKARVIQIDTQEQALGRFVEVEPELRIHADARLTAEALVAELERRGHQPVTGVRTDELRERIASFDPTQEFREESLPDKIDPRTVMLELDRILPRKRSVVADPSHQMTFTAGYLHAEAPELFAFPVEAGSIGVAVGEAIGAAFALPGTLAVAGIGDAGFMMTLADVETAVRYQVPIVIVVCNDMGLGAEVHLLDVGGVPSAMATHTTPSFAAVAEALGAEGHTIKTKADLARLEERFKQPVEGPIVIDCHVNPTVRAEWVDALHALFSEEAKQPETDLVAS
jgi:thiamine pyrophosphate-dependent acetolactate synthase large subunit-like protein